MMTSSVASNRLPPSPSLYSPSDKAMVFLTSSTDARKSASQPFYYPSKLQSSMNWWANNGPFALDTQRWITSEPNEEENDPLNLTIDESASPVKDSVDKRQLSSISNNHHQTSDPRHHFDICFVSYDVKYIGRQYYPRYIETASCQNHMQANSRIHCVPIPYHVQVLTRRTEDDPDDDETHRNALPEGLKDWRFVHIKVNVGCHCTVAAPAGEGGVHEE